MKNKNKPLGPKIPRGNPRAGGIARSKKLSKEKRKEIATMGAMALNLRLTKSERIERAKKAVSVRWERYRAGKKAGV